MNKLNGLIALCLLSCTMVSASVLTDLWQDIGTNTKLTIAEEATGCYFYNIAKGRSEVGAATPVLTYRFLSADAGYSTGYEDASRGTVLLGGSIHFDKLAQQLFPRQAAFTNASVELIAPTGLANAWRKLYFGFMLGRDMNEQNLSYGIQTGFNFRWK